MYLWDQLIVNWDKLYCLSIYGYQRDNNDKSCIGYNYFGDPYFTDTKSAVEMLYDFDNFFYQEYRHFDCGEEGLRIWREEVLDIVGMRNRTAQDSLKYALIDVCPQVQQVETAFMVAPIKVQQRYIESMIERTTAFFANIEDLYEPDSDSDVIDNDVVGDYADDGWQDFEIFI